VLFACAAPRFELWEKMLVKICVVVFISLCVARSITDSKVNVLTLLVMNCHSNEGILYLPREDYEVQC